MADTDSILGTAAGIAEPHQTTVDGILRSVRQGVFTAAEADMVIDRIRAHVSALPVSAGKVVPATAGGLASNALPHSPDRTVA